MNDVVAEKLKLLPEKPGVYLMKNKRGQIIYVGKAIKLKNRVRQYFQSSRNHSAKTIAMVSHIEDFETIITVMIDILGAQTERKLNDGTEQQRLSGIYAHLAGRADPRHGLHRAHRHCLCRRKAREVLDAMPDRVEIGVSSNIIKNVKSVVVPNTDGLKGIEAAAAAGIVAGQADKAL